MGNKITRSHASIVLPSDDDFTNQKIQAHDDSHSFDNVDIKTLKTNDAFPDGVIFKAFDASIQPDFVSSTL